MNKLTLGLLTTIIFISSCSQVKSTNPVPQSLPTPTNSWTVDLTQSGGLAGVLLTVEVTSDGQLKAADKRSNNSVTNVLPPEKTNELKRLISNLSQGGSQSPSSSCADCFIYDLEIRTEGKDIQIHVDDVTIKKSGSQDLITTLIMLRDSALKPNP